MGDAFYYTNEASAKEIRLKGLRGKTTSTIFNQGSKLDNSFKFQAGSTATASQITLAAKTQTSAFKNRG